MMTPLDRSAQETGRSCGWPAGGRCEATCLCDAFSRHVQVALSAEILACAVCVHRKSPAESTAFARPLLDSNEGILQAL